MNTNKSRDGGREAHATTRRAVLFGGARGDLSGGRWAGIKEREVVVATSGIYCRKCGYDLQGQVGGERRCPEWRSRTAEEEAKA